MAVKCRNKEDPKMAKCKGRKDSGEPCGAPENMVDEDGYCPAHRPDASERMAERGKKGAEVTNRRWKQDGGVSAEELGPLENHQEARRWLGVIGEAVTTGRLSHNAAKAAVQAVKAWAKIVEGEMDVEVKDELVDRINELEDKLAKKPNLKRVK